MGIWSFQVGRAVVGVELPYKEWNIERDPGQLPALLLPIGPFTNTG